MEREKINFEDLSTREKIDHIWEYYKLHIIGGAFAIFVLGSLLNHYVINPPADIMLDVSVFSYYMDETAADPIEEDLTNLITDNPKKEEAVIEFFDVADQTDYNMVMATQTKIIGKFSLDEFDVMIFMDGYYDMYSEEKVLTPLDDFIKDSYNITEDMMVTGEDLGYEGDDSVYLISLEGNQVLEPILYADTVHYIGIYIETTRPENAQIAFDYVFGQ